LRSLEGWQNRKPIKKLETLQAPFFHQEFDKVMPTANNYIAKLRKY
jgi:hypothetical protein